LGARIPSERDLIYCRCSRKGPDTPRARRRGRRRAGRGSSGERHRRALMNLLISGRGTRRAAADIGCAVQEPLVDGAVGVAPRCWPCGRRPRRSTTALGAQPPLMSAATRGQNPRDCAGQQWPLNDRQPTFAIGRRRAHGWRSPGTDRVRRQLPLSYRSPSETYIGQNWSFTLGVGNF
jgi:hypothetical protein